MRVGDRDLLEKMLQKDVAARIMLDEIKTHPWVTMVCVCGGVMGVGDAGV